MKLVTVSVRSAAVLAGIVMLSDPVFAQGTARQRIACTRDAFRYCAADIPNVRRITACMIRNFDRLSSRCQAEFFRSPEDGTGARDRYYNYHYY